MLRCISIALICLMAITATARADYTLTPKVGGQSVIGLDPGGSFTVDFILTSDDSSDPANWSTSAIFEVAFSLDGLQYNSYSWGSPYSTGGTDDYSDPSINAGALNTNDLLSGNIYFENFVDSGEFTIGTLVSLTLTIPGDFPEGNVYISALPDTFEGDLGTVITRKGQDFLLQVPEPATVSLLILGGLAMIRSRRR